MYILEAVIFYDQAHTFKWTSNVYPQ